MVFNPLKRAGTAVPPVHGGPQSRLQQSRASEEWGGGMLSTSLHCVRFLPGLRDHMTPPSPRCDGNQLQIPHGGRGQRGPRFRSRSFRPSPSLLI